jgi:hypothetical protein
MANELPLTQKERRIAAREKRRAAQRAAAASPTAGQPVPPAQKSFMREYRWDILKALPLGVLLPMTFFFGSVGPDDFARNYAGWARKWGLTAWADWLSLYATGPRVFWGTVLISSIYLATAFVLPYLIRHTSKNAATVAVPSIVAAIVIVAGYGQYEIGLLGERHVTEYQRAKLKEILSPIAGNFPRALVVAAIDTPEAQGYASEMMGALGAAGLKIVTLDSHGTMAPTIMRAIGTGIKGVFFQVKDPSSPTAEVRTLENALGAVNIRVRFMHNVDFPDSDYVLTIGIP